MAQYPPVERAHIVPRTYLRNFADAEGMIGMRLVNALDTEKVISIEDAGVRKRFYRRTRPDGTPIDDAEHMLGMIERRAGPVLREIEARWPLGFEDKHVLAQFFAIQILRGEQWRQGYVETAHRLVEEYREHGLFADETVEAGLLSRQSTSSRRSASSVLTCPLLRITTERSRS